MAEETFTLFYLRTTTLEDIYKNYAMNPSQHQPAKNDTTSRQDYRGGDDDYRDEYIEGEVTGFIDVMKQPVNNVIK